MVNKDFSPKVFHCAKTRPKRNWRVHVQMERDMFRTYLTNSTPGELSCYLPNLFIIRKYVL